MPHADSREFFNYRCEQYCIAVGGNCAFVEDSEGECLFFVPVGTTPGDAERMCTIYHMAFELGKQVGGSTARADIRKALGITEVTS